MIRNKYLILFVLFSCSLVGRSYELREWEDVKGNRINGRFVHELFGKLTIEDESGNPATLRIADLSEMDKKYVRVMIPPKIEVEVRTKAIPIPRRPQFSPRPELNENYVVSAQIVKKSQRPFTSRLNAELFLVAEEIGGEAYVLLSHTKGDFLLLEEKDYEYTFKSKATKVSRYEDLLTKRTRGDLYKGHLLLIASQQGEVIATTSSLPNWMQDPAVIENLRYLAVRGAPSLRSRHFGRDGKKVPPSRPPYVTPWAK